MNKSDSVKIVMMLKAAYPQMQTDQSVKGLWAMVLADCEYKITEDAVMEHICTSKSDWPPVPGVVRELVAFRTDPTLRLSAEEAWLEVQENEQAIYRGEAIEWTNDAVRAAVEACDVKAWGKESNAPKGVLRSQFVKMYQSYNARNVETLQVPANLHQNVIGGGREKLTSTQQRFLPKAEEEESRTCTPEESAKHAREIAARYKGPPKETTTTGSKPPSEDQMPMPEGSDDEAGYKLKDFEVKDDTL